MLKKVWRTVAQTRLSAATTLTKRRIPWTAGSSLAASATASFARDVALHDETAGMGPFEPPVEIWRGIRFVGINENQIKRPALFGGEHRERFQSKAETQSPRSRSNPV